MNKSATLHNAELRQTMSICS